MHLTFKETKEEVYAAQRVSKHVSPHLHNALEIVCVTEGTLEMGVGQELYHMEKGDIGFVFSDIIHHYQVFSEKTSRADYILVPSSFVGVFKDKIQGYAPKYPVIRAGQIEPDVYHAIRLLSCIKPFPPPEAISKILFTLYRILEIFFRATELLYPAFFLLPQ